MRNVGNFVPHVLGIQKLAVPPNSVTCLNSTGDVVNYGECDMVGELANNELPLVRLSCDNVTTTG